MDSRDRIVLFDGSCGFCSRWVRFIRKNDKLNKITCIPSQSDEAAELSGIKNVRDLAGDTVIFVQNERIYYRSEAAIRILANLGGWYRISKVLLIIPSSIRDYFYTLVARNRHKWSGNDEECEIKMQ